MRKLILTLSILLAQSSAFAGGKLTISPIYNFATQKVSPTAGLGVYQLLMPGLAYDMWSGAGVQFTSGPDSILWVSSKHDIVYYAGPWSFGAGVTFRAADKGQLDSLALLSNHDVHIKVGLELW